METCFKIAAILCIIAVVIASCVGAFVSRMCGGGKPKLPWGLDQFVYGLPYLLCGDGLLRLVAYAGAVIGKRLGHGQYFWLAVLRGDPAGDERFDFIVRLFFGPDVDGPKRYWRNFFGMFLSGIFVPLASCIILIAQGHVLAAAILFAGGAMKPVCYAVAQHFYPYVEGDTKALGTVYGEYGAGFFGWGSVALAAVVGALC